jgi:hypothetical protein
LTEAELERLPEALAAEGLRGEIAALRVRLETVMHERPDDFRLALAGMNTLVRMLVAEYRLSPRASQEMADSMAAMLNQMADQFLPSDR